MLKFDSVAPGKQILKAKRIRQEIAVGDICNVKVDQKIGTALLQKTRWDRGSHSTGPLEYWTGSNLESLSLQQTMQKKSLSASCLAPNVCKEQPDSCTTFDTGAGGGRSDRGS